MASPERVVPSLPETLPEDFGGWDSEDSAVDSPASSWARESPALGTPALSWDGQGRSAAQSTQSNEWEAWEAAHSPSKAAKPLGQFAQRRSILSPVVDKPRVSDSARSTPAAVELEKDFTERDDEAPSAARNAGVDEWAVWAAAHSTSKTAKQSGQFALRTAVLPSAVEMPHDSDSTSSRHVPGKPRELAGEWADATGSDTALATGTASHRPATVIADDALLQMFSSVTLEANEEQESAGKKRMIVAAVSACSILLLLLLVFSLFHHGAKAAAQQPAQAVPEVTDAGLNPDKPKPRAGERSTQNKAPATQLATDDQAASEEDGVNTLQAPTESQTRMMNEQLAAPTRIPQSLPKQAAENEPSATNFGAAGAEGLEGSEANASIFNGHARPVVQAAPAKPIAISSGIAVGMLIQKTPPVYPLMAKSARVSGTVEVQATISKMGTIKDLRAVSGPAILRQAAVDAVRTWRYQPYKLNNEPTEVETTINVVFSLGG